MKISYNWLKEFYKVPDDVNETGNILTATGLEVEGIESFESIKGGLKGLVVGEILTCEKHPNADKLSVTTVDTGNGEPTQIVCGAPNVASGQKVVVAPVGTTLYPFDKPEGFAIKKAKIRGESSEGMICSSYEIGLDESHEGIIVLDDNAKTGTPVTDLFDVEVDSVFEIGLTPNRADAASHIGVCRDLRAVLGGEVVWPSLESFTIDNHDLPIEVIVEDTKGSPRYTGVTLSDVQVKESPQWLKNRLLSIGLMPINNVVDITNYVLHSLGQPLHAFDYDEILGQKIVVKTMPKGSKFTTLDEKERKLTPEDLMICNEQEGMCIAGVFGGVKSGIKSTTKNVFLESAYFSADYIRKTATHHGLKTDASFRYERGTDPELPVKALKWAALLIKEIAGGKISSDIIDIYPELVTPMEIDVKYKNVDRLIGKAIGRENIHSILKNLEISVESVSDVGFRAVVPSYRVDVTREADVIEEILRIYGYDNVELESHLSSEFLSHFPDKDQDRAKEKIGEILVARGYYEIITNSLTKPQYAEKLETLNEDESVPIINRLSEDLGVMRQSLLPGGLEVIAHNINRRRENLKFFEFGKIYRDLNGKYKEEEMLAFFITGKSSDESWFQTSQPTSFHDLSGAVTSCLSRLGVIEYKTQSYSDGVCSSGLQILFNGQLIGMLGQVRSEVTFLAEVKQVVWYAELYWTRLLKKSSDEVIFQPVPRYPEVRRDLSLVIDHSISFAEIEELTKKTEKKLIRDINVFSVYEGENIGKNKKAYAISFILQDQNQTLKDKQIDHVMSRLIKVFEDQLGAVIRK